MALTPQDIARIAHLARLELKPEEAANMQSQINGFFEIVDHPVSGPARLSTVPMRFSGGPGVFHTHAAPLLGQHNDELLAELGLAASEIAELEADGVIGRTPAR